MLPPTMSNRCAVPLFTIGRAVKAALCSIFVFCAVSVQDADAGEARTVVELFTSQGCSSCPPADALLGDISTRDDVIALTLPVDYWDYLGWKDTFASPAHTLRQQAYARQRGDRQVYTPQMVFNGRSHTVGSHKSAVESAIAEQAALMAESGIPVTISSSDDAIMVTAGAFAGDGDAPNATVWLLLTTKLEEVDISRGENGGRRLSYSNVVRMMMPIGQWNGEAIEISLPKADLMGGYDGCTAILQVDGTGPILGASHLDGALIASN
jgi:hypothetical protein